MVRSKGFTLDADGASAEHLRNLAIDLATIDFDERVQELFAACGGRSAVLAAASRLLSGTSGAAAPEHVAYTYLAAAFQRLTTDDERS
jgi:hypothetical protein